MNTAKITDTLRRKIRHAKNEDGDFVFLPVWQAKQILEYMEPMHPRKTALGYLCGRCGHRLVYIAFYTQEYCDQCGQNIEWESIK